MQAWMLLLTALAIAIASISPSSFINCESHGFAHWQTLTKQNFSSQIRLSSHILLIVSVPWSGESRSLMKEVAQLVSEKKDEFGPLKLMYMNKKNDKMLADAIGAVEGINVLYYHNSFSYKYRGKLNANKIVSSILPYTSVSAEEIPLKKLNSPVELSAFLESADKVVILFEYCGWSYKLLDREKRNETQNGFGMQGFSGETSRVTTNGGMEDQKLQVTEGGGLKCALENGFGGIPWLGEFNLLNDSTSPPETDYSQDVENVKSSGALSCTFEEFKQFDSFFLMFLPIAREFFLSPERYRFGLVSERSLLPPLGAEDSGSWLVVIYSNGCPSCTKILKEGDDLKNVLQMDNSIVRELESDGQDLDPAVPADKPSVILFVDRSSDSSEIRRKSKEALSAFRELALDYQTSDRMGWQNNDMSGGSSVQAFQRHGIAYGHPRLKLSPTAQKMKLRDKMSIMIVNEGKQAFLDNIASDQQGSSLHEILTYLLQKKGVAKLSSIAKEVGFQLLSNDLDIKQADTLPREAEVESKQALGLSSEEDLVGAAVEIDKGSSSYPDGRSQPSGISLSSQDDKEKKHHVDTSRHLLSVISDQVLLDRGAAILEDLKAAEEGSQVDKLGDEQLPAQIFKASFFFCDGNYRLASALTGEMSIPSLVIIDPILQQHYIFSGKTNFSYSALEDFLQGFINGSLVPYQRSEFEPVSSREGTHPPFVNMDFHEADSIPRVTAHTFSDMVLGFNQSDNPNAWNEDVVVLYSNSWCGFCQRMELVVREVYRAVKGYMHTLSTVSRNNLKNAIPKLPKIFLMDCTLNDCSLILKSVDHREVYPALLLFPAEKKNKVSYDGGMVVADVIRFIADHGSNAQHLISEKGILLTVAGQRGRKQDLFMDASVTTIHKDASFAKDRSHEVLLKNHLPKRAVEYAQAQSHTSRASLEAAPDVEVGSILVATEKLGAQPFDKSKILIVKADLNAGFQGLIYNKPISWAALHELLAEYEMLKETPLYFGGPLVKRGMPLSALTRRMVQGQSPEVSPGIYLLDHSATLHEMEELKSGNCTLSDYWFFLGFSSWGWEQLFDEIAEGAWDVSKNSTGHLDWP